MVAWREPEVQEICARVSAFLTAVCVGWYTWEFLVSFSFDWDIISRKRKIRWPTIPYLFARYTCLVTAIILTLFITIQPTVSCSAWWKAIGFCAHIAITSAAMLLVIRADAVSGHKWFINAFLVVLWLAVVATLIKDNVTLQASYNNESRSCITTTTVEMRYTFAFGPLILDICCLAVTFFYLIQSRGFNLWTYLVKQGLVYLLIILVAYVSLAVLQLLNLNDVMNTLLDPFITVLIVVSATRMYRGLMDFDQSQTMMTTKAMAYPREYRGRDSTRISGMFVCSVADTEVSETLAIARTSTEHSYPASSTRISV